MSENLIIRLGHSQQDKLHWLIYSDAEQEIIASGQLQHADELVNLSDKAIGRDVIALLPAADVQLKHIALPAKWNRKLHQALPFIIEEQLACEVDELFIAVHRAVDIQGDDNEMTPGVQVAIVDKIWFASWLNCLAEHGLTPKQALPDALLLPGVMSASANAICLEQNWLIKTNDWQIAEVEPQWLSAYLNAAQIQQLKLFSPVNDNNDFDGIRLEAEQQNYDLALAIFAKQLKKNTFNLLQGQYQNKGQNAKIFRLWRAPAIAAAIALVMVLSLKVTQYYQLQQQLTVAKQSVVEQYKKAFPGSKVRPFLIKKQLQNKLRAINNGDNASLLDMLHALVPAFEQIDKLVPESLRYDDKRKELRLRAQTKDFQSFNKIKTILESVKVNQQNLAVSLGSLNNTGEMVTGEIKIRYQLEG